MSQSLMQVARERGPLSTPFLGATRRDLVNVFVCRAGGSGAYQTKESMSSSARNITISERAAAPSIALDLVQSKIHADYLVHLRLLRSPS